MPLFGPPDVWNLAQKKDVRGLLNALQYPKDDHVRERAANALAQHPGVEVERALVAALWDESSRVQKAVVNSLAYVGNTTAANLLLREVGQEDTARRRTALQGLSGFASQATSQVAQALLAADWKIKGLLAQVLAFAKWQPAPGDPAGIQFFILQDKWSQVVAAGSQALEPLLSALHAGVRQESVLGALGQLGGERALAALLGALDDPIYPVRLAAAKGLQQVGWQPGTDRQAGWYWAALREWESCAQVGAPAVEALIASLGAYDRRSVAHALMKIYTSGMLDDKTRSLILAQREILQQPHADRHSDYEDPPPPGCDIGFAHIDHYQDTGIGVDFPL